MLDSKLLKEANFESLGLQLKTLSILEVGEAKKIKTKS